MYHNTLLKARDEGAYLACRYTRNGFQRGINEVQGEVKKVGAMAKELHSMYRDVNSSEANCRKSVHSFVSELRAIIENNFNLTVRGHKVTRASVGAGRARA